ncbi:unnamed protein product, partial [Musa acuminata subsp. burmannicoides]
LRSPFRIQIPHQLASLSSAMNPTKPSRRSYSPFGSTGALFHRIGCAQQRSRDPIQKGERYRKGLHNTSALPTRNIHCTGVKVSTQFYIAF